MFGRHLLTNLAIRTNKQSQYFFARMRRKQKDYYKILQVSPYATPEQIKNNYYSLSNNYNPDLSQDSQSQMVKLNQAYDVLSNPTERQKYDLQRGIPKRPVAQKKSSNQQNQNIQGSSAKYSFGSGLMFNFVAGIVITSIFILIFGPRQQRAQRPMQQNYGHNVQSPQIQNTQEYNRKILGGYKEN